MFSKFTEEAQKIILMAKREMQNLKHPYVGSEHLLLAILYDKDSEISNFLAKCDLTYEKCKKEIINVIGVGKSSNDWFLFTPLLKRVLESAMNCSKDEDSLITVPNIFTSLLEEGEGVANRILMGMNIDIDALYEKFSLKFISKSNNANKKLFVEEYAIDYNKIFKNEGFDPVIGRDMQVNRLMEVLLRRSKNNPLLIGDAGVGKTAIVEEFVRRIEQSNVPKKLGNKRVLGLSMSSLIAGTKYRGEFEERINQIIGELEEDDSIILFIDEIHTLVGAGGAEGAIDASNILKPYLARGKIRVIGATTKDEYSKFIEPDKALDRRFQKVFVNEMSLDETKNVLYELRGAYEKYHGVIISNSVIEEIIRLCDKYISIGKFPDKAIDIFDEVCAKRALIDTDYDKKVKKLELDFKMIKEKKNAAIINNDYVKARALKEEQNQCENKLNRVIYNREKSPINKEVTLDNLYDVVYERTKIPISNLKTLNKKDLICKLKETVIGQDTIIEKIVEMTCSRSNVIVKRPLVFLLVGKSGVGKTFLAKEYAKCLYNKESFIRLDMSEYRDDFSSSKIIGSPPGYIGYSDNNNLLDKVKNNPYAILLLDEVEKACVNVLKLFLQAFDEGVMTNAKGETIDFRNITVIMTSNLGTNKNSCGFICDDKDFITDRFRDFLGIEFVNRIDEVLVFNDLNKSTIEKIIKNKLTKCVEKEKLEEIISTDIVDKVLKKCDYLVSGARKIDRVIENVLEEETILKI